MLSSPSTRHTIRYRVVAPLRRLRRGVSGRPAPIPQPPLERYRAPGRETFGGYYDTSPLSADGRVLLAHATPGDGPVTQSADDMAQVGYFERGRGDLFHEIDTTPTWCSQMGARLRWFPGSERTVAYNTMIDGHPCTRIRDLQDPAADRTVRWPLYDIASDGRTGLSVNFGRLAWLRPGYGYPVLDDPHRDDPAPRDDGVWSVDIDSGTAVQVVSLADLAGWEMPTLPAGAFHYINHVSIAPGGERLMFFHLWAPDPTDVDAFSGRLCFAEMDGSGLWSCTLPGRPSHYCWTGDNAVCVSILQPDHSASFVEVRNGVGIDSGFWPDAPRVDGHQTLSQDGRRMLVDSYPDRFYEQRLAVYEMNGRILELGRYRPEPGYFGELRCDLHPRWSPSGNEIVFDSAHKEGRAMYLIDLGRQLTSHARGDG